jgi:AcrR family transcriptional regulator
VKQAYHHRDLRQGLVDEALRVLANEGPSALTLRELGRRLGVTHAAAYAHFPDKGALLREVGNAGFAQLAHVLAAARATEQDPRAALAAMGRAYVAFAKRSPHLYRLMFADDALAHGTDCDPPAIDMDAFALLIEAVAALRPRSPDEVLEASVAVWSMVHGLSMLEIDRRIGYKIDPGLDMIGSATRLLFEGLA